MTVGDDLFPGFSAHWLDTRAGRLFARSAGSGPPVLLLHGFPQTQIMWHRIAAEIARDRTVILLDLPGYGWSSIPPTTDDHRPYSKRAMAQAVVEAMEALGHVHFALVGHDRGGRVGYRLALDHPGRLSRLAVLDIVPTLEMWDRMDAARALKTYHWAFLAQPDPMPETLIGGAPIAWLEHTLASWTKARSLAAFDRRALSAYRDAFNDPARIHACCEDYRAGAGVDREDDAADRADGRRIAVPMLALWGAAGIPGAGRSPLEVWREWAVSVEGIAIDAGHFVAEENPGETLAALRSFLAA
ncbi:MAG: alpha/beta fold hydrolase [Labrys sp. (in: a-proteobacteria)]